MVCLRHLRHNSLSPDVQLLWHMHEMMLRTDTHSVFQVQALTCLGACSSDSTWEQQYKWLRQVAQDSRIAGCDSPDMPPGMLQTCKAGKFAMLLGNEVFLRHMLLPTCQYK